MILSGKPTGKRPLGIPRRSGEDSIRMDLIEIGFNTRNSNWLTQGTYYWRALVYNSLNLQIV